MQKNEKSSQKEILRAELDAKNLKINFLISIKNDILNSLGVVSPHLEYEFMAHKMQDIYKDISDKCNNTALDIIQKIIDSEEILTQKLSHKIHGVK
jgi:hypothetical protein